MADYGIKISKEGYDVKAIPTEATKKNFIILDATEAHKLFYKGFVSGGSYTHNLGYKPVFFVFSVTTTSSPVYYQASRSGRATTTQITNLPNPCYLMIFYEGL